MKKFKPDVASFGRIAGISPAVRDLCAKLHSIASRDVHVLIEGETGTGKEVVARALHQRFRPRGPFVAFDARRLDDDEAMAALLQAVKQKRAAVFLDEVGELPYHCQGRLLRALDQGIRVISATQYSLEERVFKRRFSKKLYQLLSGAKVQLPPLRTRLEDIPLLVEQLQEELGLEVRLSTWTLACFQKYDWPGNVRELRNALIRCAILGETAVQELLEANWSGPIQPGSWPTVSTLPYRAARKRALLDFDRVYLTDLLRRVAFDLAEACRITGLSLPTLYRLLKQCGIRLKNLRTS